MPFVRFSRDKRGYEHFYLVHQTTGRRGKSRSRILFWFRTPPNVRVGREPFAPEVRKALDAQYPGMSFDWDKLVATPIPPPEVEPRWRERRRAERAARQATSAENEAQLAELAEIEPGMEAISELETPGEAIVDEQRRPVDDLGNADVSILETGETQSEPSVQAPPGQEPKQESASARRRRRRRRGGRGNRPLATPPTDTPPTTPEGE